MGAEAAVESKSFAFVESLAADLSGGTLELPSFPDVVIRIRKALEDDNCTTAKLAQLIGSEPALAARLLQIANSAAMRRGPDPVSDVNTAIGLLGWDIVRSSAMSFAMKQIRDEQTLYAMLDEWHPGIGKAILESMEFDDEIAAAVGDYLDFPRQHEGEVDFTDLLMMANIVAGLLGDNDGFEVQLDEVPASQYFTTSVEEFFEILTESAEHISSLRHALGT